MKVPRLFIVAGPNGSGKSLFSESLTTSDFVVFDGQKFPETGSEALWSHINNEIFAEEKIKAIANRLDYAFETNFSSIDPMSSMREFKVDGYEIHLIFMGLNSLAESIERVAYRVGMGGHKVSEESIRYNYEHGYKNLYKYYKDFDSVTIFDNSIAQLPTASVPTKLLFIQDGRLNLTSAEVPIWIKPILKDFDIL